MRTCERSLVAEGETGVARIGVLMEPEWVGRSIALEGRRDDGLRRAIIEAQNGVLDLLRTGGDVMDDLKVRWVYEEVDGTGYHWNPQNPITADTVVLYCIGECIYV